MIFNKRIIEKWGWLIGLIIILTSSIVTFLSYKKYDDKNPNNGSIFTEYYK